MLCEYQDVKKVPYVDDCRGDVGLVDSCGAKPVFKVKVGDAQTLLCWSLPAPHAVHERNLC